MKTIKKQTIWQRLLKIALIVIASLCSSQLATNNEVVDSIVKTAIVETSNVLIDVLSSQSNDTAIIITDKSDSEQVPVLKTKN